MSGRSGGPSAADVALWEAVRRAVLMVVAAVDRRMGIERKPEG